MAVLVSMHWNHVLGGADLAASVDLYTALTEPPSTSRLEAGPIPFGPMRPLCRIGRKLVARALVEVGETSTVLSPRNSSAWTMTA